MKTFQLFRASTVLTACAVVAVTAFSTPSLAQDTGDVARRLVGEGIEAARSRDWITARDRFERAYEIQPLPLTLYNLAAAQEKTGELVEADRSYRIFLRETTPGENDDFRRIALERRKALKSKICYVVITAENLEGDDVISLGKQEVSHAVLGESLPSNPGNLNIRVERSGEVITTERLTMEEGSTHKVRLSLPAYEPPVATPPPARASPSSSSTAARSTTPSGASSEPGPAGSTTSAGSASPDDRAMQEDESSFLASPVLWGVVGAIAIGFVGVVVLAVAGSGGGVIAYFSPSSTAPTDSTIDGVAIEGR